MNPAVQKAIQTIMQALGGAESRAMGGQAAPPEPHAEPDGDEMCPECAAGTCDNPDHMDDSSKAAMLNEMG
jgi:hypothetical protein